VDVTASTQSLLKKWFKARVKFFSSKGWEMHFWLAILLRFSLFLCCFSNPTCSTHWHILYHGAKQIAYTNEGSAYKLSEQGLDLRNTANKTLPSWLLPKLTANALKASSRPDTILFLPSTVCSSRVTTRNSKFQQLAKDKKLNPNQWDVHLIEFKFCEDTRHDP